MPLIDTGLVCRYYFDEAASGTTPTSVVDRSGNSYDLTEINYGSGNMAYVESSGNRGLESTSTTGTQRARRGINNSSDALRDALAGVQKCTIEFVARLDAYNASGGRIFGINGRSGQNGELVVKYKDTNGGYLFLSWNDTDDAGETVGQTVARAVYHIVIDTTQATQADRVKLYIDGAANTWTDGTSITQNATLTLGSDLDLICFNRESSGNFERSIDGVMYYAALYADALTAQDCEDNYDILIVDDDQPAAPPAANSGFFAFM